jgi:hypothetical protein
VSCRAAANQCVEFYPGVFDPGNPRKGGSFELIQEEKWDNSPEDELRHDVTDEFAERISIARKANSA